jgi:2'-5' RNA ligase
MAHLRVFIAVDPGKAIRSRCVALQETLARSADGVRWEKPENIHITLLFLGETDERDVLPVCRAVTEACAGRDAFVLGIEGVGCFPSPRRPRTLWAGVGSGAADLIALHDALEPPLLALGCYRREERAYSPHLTVGRVKGERPADRLAQALARQSGWRGGETTVEEVLVMASELRPDGPIYSVLSRAPLRKAGGRGEGTG